MRLGVLDIGSNTVHLLLVDAHPGARPIPFASHKQPLQLLAFQDADGAITEAGQRELIEFIRGALEFAAVHEAQDVLAFATSALREAANGAAVLECVHEATGIRLTELSGEEEAAATFLAVRRWYGWGAGTILGLDIGGGSFELAIGADEDPAFAVSVPLGAGRVTRDWLDADRPSARSIKDARRQIRAILADPITRIRDFGEPNFVAATSKSFRSLARITGAASRAAGPYVQRELRLRDLTLWASRLGSMTSADRARLPGVSDMRAGQLLGAALVAEAALDGLGISSVRICPWALREGLILRRFDQLTAG